MEKRFIYFSTKAKFLGATQGTEYLFTSIVFIGDTKEIWNRGIFYGTPNDFDINDYLLKSDAASTYQPKGNYLTEHQDLSEYAKTSELEEAIKDFATKSYVDEAVAGVDVTEQLVNYATKEYVGQEIAKIEIPSIEGLASEEYVDDAIEGLSAVYQPKGNYLTEHQSLADYAKSADVTEEISEAVEGLSETYYSKSEVDAMWAWGEY